MLKVNMNSIVKIITKNLHVAINYVHKWFTTNWSRIIKTIDSIIVDEKIVYSSRCWKCKTPIRAVKSDNKFAGWLQNKWLGNKKCEKDGCNYFICNKCGKCYCDYPYKTVASSNHIDYDWKTTDEMSVIAHCDCDKNKTLKIGSVVKHKIFGKGKVVGLFNSDKKNLVTINFDKHGVKQLLTEYAGLTILG